MTSVIGGRVQDMISGILNQRYHMPDRKMYTGSNAPDRFLANMLKTKDGKIHSASGHLWTIKFGKSKSDLTLFQKKVTYGGNTLMRDLAIHCGYRRNGIHRFSHTVNGVSSRNFYVTVDDKTVSVSNASYPEIVPAWDLKDLKKIIDADLDSIIVIFGKIRKDGKKKRIKFDVSMEYSKFRFNEFKRGLEEGWISIDFDVEITKNNSLKDRGTEFRIKTQDMGLLYSEVRRIHPNKRRSSFAR